MIKCPFPLPSDFEVKYFLNQKWSSLRFDDKLSISIVYVHFQLSSIVWVWKDKTLKKSPKGFLEPTPPKLGSKFLFMFEHAKIIFIISLVAVFFLWPWPCQKWDFFHFFYWWYHCMFIVLIPNIPQINKKNLPYYGEGSPYYHQAI